MEGILGNYNVYHLVKEARKDLGPNVPIIAMSDAVTNRLLMEAGCSHQTQAKHQVAELIKSLLSITA